MKIAIQPRTAGKKGVNNRLRREEGIPAVIYVRSKESEPISVDRGQFSAAIREMKKGRLPTTPLTLVTSDSKERRVITKGIQYHPTTYLVEHLDFEELHDEVPIKVNVPVECIGVADCVGIKEGGAVRQVKRTLRVCCLPKDMPASFKLDIKNLSLGGAKKLKDLEIPSTMRALDPLNEVAVAIVKR